MTGVLFVCLGNICRSPMAEGIFRKLVRERGLSERFHIDSAGTAAYHEGEEHDPRTMRLLAKHGASFDGRARQVRPDDFHTFDYILAMDISNLRNLQRVCPSDQQHRLHMALAPVGGGDVKDPYYGGADGFEQNYRELSEALEQWLDRWS